MSEHVQVLEQLAAEYRLRAAAGLDDCLQEADALDAGAAALRQGQWQRDQLEESLRSGLLFGHHDEPLGEHGKRLVRVILEVTR